jgi:hypothetical protein
MSVQTGAFQLDAFQPFTDEAPIPVIQAFQMDAFQMMYYGEPPAPIVASEQTLILLRTFTDRRRF